MLTIDLSQVRYQNNKSLFDCRNGSFLMQSVPFKVSSVVSRIPCSTMSISTDQTLYVSDSMLVGIGECV